MNSWKIRPAVKRDLNFIYATWLNNYRYDSPFGKGCSNTIFFTEYPKIIDLILSRKDAKITIAFHQDDPDIIIAYLVSEPGIIHYLFTKKAFQKNGVAKLLVENAFPDKTVQVYHTHQTTLWEVIIHLRKFKSIFNPFLLYEKANLERESL